jgi:hypothetical protein
VARRINKKTKVEFLTVLAQTGNVVEAARVIGRDRGHLYEIRDRDPEFARAWDASRTMYLDEIEGQVLDWAINGYNVASTETVVDAQGNQVGMQKRKIERRYDARLALRVLERRHPDYKPGQDVAISTPTGVLIVPGISESEEAWEEEFGAGSTDD